MDLSSVSDYPLNVIARAIRVFNCRRAEHQLKSNGPLWGTLQDYLAKSGSTGAGYTDYWVLYDYVKRNRPEQILECGTGVTTIVLAQALKEIHEAGGPHGIVTSMEDYEQWYTQASNLLPEHLKPYVNIVFSEKTEYFYSIFRGVGYKDVPELDYDFVFVDGPGTKAPSDGTRTFDFDFINIVKRSEKGVFGIVDKRLGTCYVLQKVFGLEKVKYDSKLGLGFVGPVRKNDMLTEITSASFDHKIRQFGSNELNLHMYL